MYQLRLTLETPATNVALDEALLEAAEAGQLDGEVLRLWESPVHSIVMGRSSPASEVRADDCRQAGIPIVRRSSGGGAVAIGPGCLMYALVLNLTQRVELRGIDRTHIFVLSQVAQRLKSVDPTIELAGTSDLVFRPSPHDETLRKFSGNSLRVRRRHVLYHGTILYNFDLTRMGRWLGVPTREPAYRQGRAHESFVANLPVAQATLEAALRGAWQADEPLDAELQCRLQHAIATRLGTAAY